MAIINDFKKDFKRILLEDNIKQVDIATKTGKPTSYINTVPLGEVIKKGFVSTYEAMGYDIEIHYIKREPKNE